MRLEAGMTAEELAESLRRAARAGFGAERAEQLEPQLCQHAAWLARIAAEPVELDAESPDLSGLEEPR
jgi:hypothetical protein